MAKRSEGATVQVGLRLKERLRRLLANEAKKAGRSLNQEMTWRLAHSFNLEQDLNDATLRIAEQEEAAAILALAKDMLRQAKELNELSSRRRRK